jgi:uncharacterized membrane protein YfcA
LISRRAAVHIGERRRALDAQRQGATKLLTSLALFPVALVATLIGIWLVRRVPREPFYKLLYASQLVVSVKLLWDGLRQVLG